MFLDGYKTYVSAILAFAGALYFVIAGEAEQAFTLFIAGLGLLGIRSAIEKV